jgi:hypothetical protein
MEINNSIIYLDLFQQQYRVNFHVNEEIFFLFRFISMMGSVSVY